MDPMGYSTLPETNIAPEKNGGWETWGCVSFREGIPLGLIRGSYTKTGVIWFSQYLFPPRTPRHHMHHACCGVVCRPCGPIPSRIPQHSRDPGTSLVLANAACCRGGFPSCDTSRGRQWTPQKHMREWAWTRKVQSFRQGHHTARAARRVWSTLLGEGEVDPNCTDWFMRWSIFLGHIPQMTKGELVTAHIA